MISEGQAEPWETTTVPPSPQRHVPFSCPPEQVIINYNSALRWPLNGDRLYTYLFWGAEYWLLRNQSGDPSYLQAFARVLKNS